MHPVTRPRAKGARVLSPETPDRRLLVDETVTALVTLDVVIDALKRHRQRHRWNQPQHIQCRHRRKDDGPRCEEADALARMPRSLERQPIGQQPDDSGRRHQRGQKHPPAHAPDDDRHEVVQERQHAEGVQPEAQPMARLADLRHLVEQEERHQQQEEHERPGAGAASEIQDHVGAEQTAVEEVQHLDVVPPPSPHQPRRRPAAGGLAMLQHDQTGEHDQIEQLNRQVGARVDALDGEDVEQEPGTEHHQVGVVDAPADECRQ